MKNSNSDVQNIYKLDGRVPIGKAIPFGLQHILAMFVGNIAPIIIVGGACGLERTQMASLIQVAMLIAGIGTAVQLYPVWRLGARLPIVMGISFTFVSVLCSIGGEFGYSAVLGCTLVGGLLIGVIGLFAKYWRKIISPVVAATVVTAIGFSLLNVGAKSFGGGVGAPDFGAFNHLIVGGITLASCLIFNAFAKSYLKQLSILFGLIVGYIVAIPFGLVDFSPLFESSLISLPEFMPMAPTFPPGAVLSVCIIFIVSAVETIGDTSALAIALKRDVTDREIAGSLSCDGFVSALSALFGCLPITSFSQNIGLVNMTKVVNRFTILMGAIIMCLAGVFPIIGSALATLPNAVLGGCTIMMFGTILVSGFQMLSSSGFSQRNITIVALALSIGLGFTQTPEIFSIFPEIVRDIFEKNCVATSFIVALVLDLCLPRDKKKADEVLSNNQAENKSDTSDNTISENDPAPCSHGEHADTSESPELPDPQKTPDKG